MGSGTLSLGNLGSLGSGQLAEGLGLAGTGIGSSSALNIAALNPAGSGRLPDLAPLNPAGSGRCVHDWMLIHCPRLWAPGPLATQTN